MTLRASLLTLFAVLGLGPLLALSVFGHMRASASVRRVVAAQTSAVAARVARQANARLAIIDGDLTLLAGNAEAGRFLATGRGHDAAAAFLRDALSVVGEPVVSVTFHDRTGAQVMAIGDTTGDGRMSRFGSAPATVLRIESITGDRGDVIGSMRAILKLESIVVPGSLSDRAGATGYTLVVDRRSRRVLADATSPNESVHAQAVAAMEPDSLLARGIVEYTEGDTARLAAIAPVGDELFILAAGSLDEFGRPVMAVSSVNLAIALSVIAVLTVAMLLAARRLSRPIESLTTAAEQVGRGNFRPSLPASGTSEIVRLANGFRTMGDRLGAMVNELERSHQMAAVGTFSAQIAHEIRNPLTSIKLNLQGLARELNGKASAEHIARPLEICMSEINRLDSVVHRVLRLARRDPLPGGTFSVNQVVAAAIALTAAQVRDAGLDCTSDLGARYDTVTGSADDVRAAVLNVLLNAVDAVPCGGRLRVATANAGANGEASIVIRVADSGPGVAAADRERIFEAFHTTKASGNGLGLALAARDVERHGGRLTVIDGSGELGGATFVIELPLTKHATAS